MPPGGDPGDQGGSHNTSHTGEGGTGQGAQPRSPPLPPLQGGTLPRGSRPKEDPQRGMLGAGCRDNLRVGPPPSPRP
ncbi:hypothetical protein DSO57_1031612 [Entomophthora muscae]|uniref:Uncharacterized protein n=1 Tax=Entomophthora muscae TaxID=34485 RepID=A0ACC2TYX1_9FUNG|nr:hypothetical protein DSO57_1031612 [Entomophthora muscae]